MIRIIKKIHPLFLILFIAAMTAVPYNCNDEFGCESNDSDKNDENQIDENDDDDDGKQYELSCDKYKEYRGWFYLIGFSGKVQDYWRMYGSLLDQNQFVEARIIIDENERLTLRYEDWILRARWSREDGYFPMNDGDTVLMAAKSKHLGDDCYTPPWLWITDLNGDTLLFQTMNFVEEDFTIDGKSVSLGWHRICKYLDKKDFPSNCLLSASNISVEGMVDTIPIFLEEPGAEATAQNGKYNTILCYGYDGIFDSSTVGSCDGCCKDEVRQNLLQVVRVK